MSTEDHLPATSAPSTSAAGAAPPSESNVPSSTATVAKDSPTPKIKKFFSPLKTKGARQMQDELRPDLCIGNVLACDTNKVATIRRPHNPLKCPASEQSCHDYANVIRPSTQVSLLSSFPFHVFRIWIERKFYNQSDVALDEILHDIEDLSKGIEHMQFHNNRIYEGNRGDEMQPPFRTEMSVILSYDGTQKKLVEKQQAVLVPRADNNIATDGPDTPTQTLPRAMKLLPPTLPYVKQDAPSSPTDSHQDKVERENHENNTVQDTSLDAPTKYVKCVQPPEKIDESVKDAPPKCAKNGNTMISMRKHFFGRRSSVGKIKHKSSMLDASCGNQSAEYAIEGKEPVESGQADGDEIANVNNIDLNPMSCKMSPEVLTRTKSPRRVSISFTGQSNHAGANESPLSNESNIAEPPTLSNEMEDIKHTPILCSRRNHSISSRQDSIGSILYPSSPFYSRRATKKSMLSRRHSDGLLPLAHRSQYYPHMEYGGSGHGTRHMQNRHHHHHHHGIQGHHHHQAMSYKEQESLQDMLGTCNSLASSRESSTSLSQRSTSQQQKRKISITSHSQSGGKIPWCACWGNGCI